MPRWPKIYQLAPKLMATSANIAPKTHQDPRGAPPKVPKTYKNLRFFNVFCFYVFSSKCSPNAPQIGHKAANMAPASPSWVLLGASWPQSPANLAPTWPILALSGSILAPSWPFQPWPKLAKTPSKTNLEPRWSKTAPNNGYLPPKTSPDIDFLYFLLFF